MLNQTNHTSPGNAAILQRIWRKSSTSSSNRAARRETTLGPIGLVTHSSAKEPSAEVMRQFGSSEIMSPGDTSPIEIFPVVKNTADFFSEIPGIANIF